MLVGGVVEHHVQGEQHVALAQGLAQLAQVIQRSRPLVDVAKIAHRVAAVAGAGRALQDRHYVHHVDAQFFEVRQLLVDPRQVAGEGVGVQRHAHPALVEKPVRPLLALHVELLVTFVAVDVVLCQHLHQAHHLRFEIIALAVELPEQRMDGVKIGAQAGVEIAQVALAEFRLEPVENAVQQGV